MTSSGTSPSAETKTLWVLFVIFLPFLGVFVYLIARGGAWRSAQAPRDRRRRHRPSRHPYGSRPAPAGAADQIASAKSLLDSGTITQAEFEALKAKALAA